MNISTSLTLIVVSVLLMSTNCSNEIAQKPADLAVEKPTEKVYDEAGCLYTAYKGLVMAGYQGWFTAEGDGAERGWHHYEKNGKFVGIEQELGTDYYLWLAGKAADWFHGRGNYGTMKPVR
jgi:hypothetical protein